MDLKHKRQLCVTSDVTVMLLAVERQSLTVGPMRAIQKVDIKS